MSFPSRFESPEFKSTAYRLASGMPFSSLVITLSSSDTVSSGLVSSGVVSSSLVTSEEDPVSSSLVTSEEASLCSSFVTSEEASFVISSAFMFIENIVLESCNVDNAKTSTAARTERIFILFILVFLPKMCFYWHSVCADTSCIISLLEIAVLR